MKIRLYGRGQRYQHYLGFLGFLGDRGHRRAAFWGACSTLVGAMAHAQGLPSVGAISADDRIEALQRQVTEQGRQIELLRERVSEQSRLEAARERAARQAMRDAPGAPANGAAASVNPATEGPGGVAGGAPGSGGQTVRVGTAPAEPEVPAVNMVQLFDQPGVLTPRGKFVFEPSFQYGYSSSNRVALVGYTVIPALLIGLVDVREVKRTAFTAAVTGRWGLTNRLEAELKLPYVHRSDDTVSREIFTGAAFDNVFNTKARPSAMSRSPRATSSTSRRPTARSTSARCGTSRAPARARSTW